MYFVYFRIARAFTDLIFDIYTYGLCRDVNKHLFDI